MLSNKKRQPISLAIVETKQSYTDWLFDIEKVLCIFDKIDSGKKFINSTNENAKLLTSSNKDGNKDYDSLVYNQAIDSDILVSTCLLSEGVEIKDKETKTIVLDGITDIERFVQSTARVRDNETKVYYKKTSYQRGR